MGKKEIGELTIQELLVSILSAEIIAIGIEKYDTSIIYTIVPILLLLGLELLGGFISLRCNKLKNIIEGKPILLINRGIINHKEMVKQRYSLDDLLFELRNNNIKDLKDVEYAVLENNGKLNIFKYNFLRLNSSNPFPLILDGVVQKDTLEYIEKDSKWIQEYIKKNNLELKDIFYAFYKNNKVYVIKRNELKM